MPFMNRSSSKSQKFGFVLLALAAFTLSGCVVTYLPSVHNTPMFSNKHEFQASVSTTLGVSNGLRGDVQTAYAITNHLGVTANYSLSTQEEEKSTFTKQAGEIGLGYFTSTSENWCFEVYSGVGFGKGHGLTPFELTGSRLLNSSTDVRYQTFFIQPAIGMNKGPKLWNFSLKINNVNFSCWL